MSALQAPDTSTMATPVTASARRHQQGQLVPPHPPDDDEKYSYIQRNLPYLTTVILIGSCCLIISQIRLETQDLLLSPFLLFTGIYIVYQAISLPVNFAGAGFDLAAHQARIATWHPPSYPDVDIYLPICGEPIELLRNTWTAVSDLIENYQGQARAYVLDDGPSEEARSMAGSFGFSYIHRPDGPPARRPATCATPSPKPAPNTWSSWTRTSRRARISWPRRCLTWTIRRSRSCRPRSTSGPARRRRGSSGPRGRSRRCSTGRFRWPASGWTRRLLRDLRGLPADRARAAGRPDAHPLRRGRAHRT